MLNFLKRILGGRSAGLQTAEEFVRASGSSQENADVGLRGSEEQFAQLVSGVRDYAVFLLDRHGNVVTWNSGAERIKGYRGEEIIGQHFSVFYTPEAVERGWPQHELEVAKAVGRFEDDGWRVRKGGPRFWANVVMTALRDEAGNLRGVSKIVRDLTERKRAEEELRGKNEALAEADRRKDAFVAMLAHELRNPLAPLRNALHVLGQRGSADPAFRQSQEMMERQVRHLARIVDDLLDVSRVMRGKVQLRPERLDLARLVRTAALDHQGVFRQAGLDLDLDVPELPVWVMGDSIRLAQILSNLLHNAAKFTDLGGRVSVRLTVAGGDKAEVAVRDTGVGIGPDMLVRLFETFAQADRSLERSKGGLGLGLALVKGLAELHGGEVHAASAGPGCGAEFTVRLPVEPEPAALSEMPAGPRRTAKHLRVLVVEDNRDAADSLRMLLELYGYEATVAHSGPDGVKAAQQWQPDVVLCDIGLPGLDGYGVARRLRQNPSTAKARLIAVTGYGAEDDRRRSQEVGFDAHLVKPVDPAALQGVLLQEAPA